MQLKYNGFKKGLKSKNVFAMYNEVYNKMSCACWSNCPTNFNYSGKYEVIRAENQIREYAFLHISTQCPIMDKIIFIFFNF